MVQKARARQLRSRVASKRSRTTVHEGQGVSRKAALAAAKPRKAARSRRQSSAPKRKAAQERGLEIFDQQIDAVWTRFTSECGQFAEGYNQELGSHQMQLEENPAGLMVKLPSDGAEVFFQLDRTERHIQCVMSSGCTSFGSCITEQAPVGLTIMDGRLQFVYNGHVVSEEELAVNVLTRLVEAGLPTTR
jgi:hypothetical protein